MLANIIDGSSQESAIRTFLDILIKKNEYKLTMEDLLKAIGRYFEADRS